MSRRQEYDFIVIGAGQGGVPFARDAAAAGWKTALIERKHVGGTCINEGCTPTKTMIASARVAHLARRGPEYGILAGPVRVDMRRVRARKQDMVESWRTSSENRIAAADNLALLRGSARFIGPFTLAVSLDQGELEVISPVIVIDSGTRPAVPELPGIEEIPYLTSTSVMELDEVPEHLVILGGGYVAVEFAQMFRRFGSQITLVERGPRLLSHEDEEISEAVAQILREDGVQVLADATADHVMRGEAGLDLEVITPSGRRVVSGSHLLVATGRTPNTEDLELDRAAIRTDARGFIPVNDRLETEVPGIYAIGDVNGGPAFTHVSYDDYRVLGTNLLTGDEASTDGRLLPYTVFLDPQLGRIGLTEREARALGHQVLVGRLPMSHVARALELDEARGFMKVVVDGASDQILGAAVLAVEGGEIMAILQTAILGGIPTRVLREAMFAHPTLAEALNNLFASLSTPLETVTVSD